jgi:hypothetical protein
MAWQPLRLGDYMLHSAFLHVSYCAQVVAGLKPYISREELTGRLVVVVLNLKPAKLAGELSEAVSRTLRRGIWACSQHEVILHNATFPTVIEC